MSDQAIWDATSDLFIYPEERATPTLKSACLLLVAEGGPLGEAARNYQDFLETTAPTRREELFTRTFDINPSCSLEIGWQLFGEEYARGTFLVDMRGTMRGLGVEEGGELPDHLTSALRVLGRLVPFKAGMFSTHYIQPAIAKMLTGFTDGANAWHPVLVALLAVLESEYGEAQIPEAVSTESRPNPYDAVPNACSPEMS